MTSNCFLRISLVSGVAIPLRLPWPRCCRTFCLRSIVATRPFWPCSSCWLRLIPLTGFDLTSLTDSMSSEAAPDPQRSTSYAVFHRNYFLTWVYLFPILPICLIYGTASCMGCVFISMRTIAGCRTRATQSTFALPDVLSCCASKVLSKAVRFEQYSLTQWIETFAWSNKLEIFRWMSQSSKLLFIILRPKYLKLETY